MEWRKIEDEKSQNMTMWNPETKNVVEGRYVDKQEGKGEFNSKIYVIEIDEENVIGVWGNTVIDGKMKKAPMGAMVRIEYKGQKKGASGRTYKDFDVYEGTDSPENGL